MAPAGETPGDPQVGRAALKNAPNSFRAAATIAFTLPEAGEVTLLLTDVTGLYFCRLETADSATTERMIRLP